VSAALDQDLVSDLHFAKAAKECVAMTGDHDIP
jgi:hypothetical protein